MDQHGIAKPEDLVGVPDEEILNLERHFDLTFPTTYRQFLARFGRSAGYLSPWMAIYYDDLKEIREQYELMAETNPGSPDLPAQALIIGNWESIFDFIVCDQGEDPEVYRIELCDTNNSTCRCYSASYSSYLENMVKTADTTSISGDFFEQEIDALAEDIITF